MVLRLYAFGDLDGVIAIFRSNIPQYFAPDEEAGLRDFLTKFADDYYVVEIDDEIIGAGGIALNKDNTVSLCWGMVRSDKLGMGLGKKLTEFRIEKSREKYCELPIVASTSQHTLGFYEKFGFRLIEHTPDGFAPGLDICKIQLRSLR